MVENCSIEDPVALLDHCWVELARDWVREQWPSLQRADAGHLEEQGVKDVLLPRLLRTVDDHLQEHGKTNADVNLPAPPDDSPGEDGTIRESRGVEHKLCEQHARYANDEVGGLSLRDHVRLIASRFNDDQREHFDAVINAVQAAAGLPATTGESNAGHGGTGNSSCFFMLKAPGGYGKTFLTNAIIARARADGHTVLATAATRVIPML